MAASEAVAEVVGESIVELVALVWTDMAQPTWVRTDRSTKRLAQWGALAWALALAVATLRPGAGNQVSPFLWCLSCGELGGRDVLLNVLAFVPLGALVAFATGRPFAGALAGLALSLVAEGAQATIVPGRDPSLSDIITNTVGGSLGGLLAAGWRPLVRPDPRAARWLTTIAAVVWLGAMSLAAQAMRRSGGAPEYWGQWAHKWPKLQPFLGRVFSFTVDGVPVPDDRVAKAGTIQAMSVGDSVEIRTTVLPAAPTSGLAPIVSVSNESKGTIFLLGQDHRDLLFHVRTHAADAGFVRPTFRVADVFPGCAAQCDSSWTMSLQAVVTPRAITLVASSRAGGTRIQRFAVDPLLAWSAVAPGHASLTASGTLVGAALAALALAALAYWTARLELARRSPLAAWSLLAAVTAAGLVAPALVAGIAVPRAGAWIVCAVGLSIGIALAARAREPASREPTRSFIRPPAA